MMNIAVFGGAGAVGWHAAKYIALLNPEHNIRLLLIDIPRAEERLVGLKTKLRQCIAAANGKTTVLSVLASGEALEDYHLIKDAAVVINAAGFPRGKGETRADVNKKNASITRSVARAVKHYAPNAIFLQIANQADTQTRIAYEILKTRKKVLSMNYLDQVRLKETMAAKSSEPSHLIQAILAGTHDNFMVPLFSQCRVNARAAVTIFDHNQLEEITHEIKAGGKWMIEKMGSSSEEEPGACAGTIVRSILQTKNHEIFSLGIYLEGEWGFSGGLMGLPCTVSLEGAIPIKKPDNLSASEEEQLQAAFEHSKKIYNEAVVRD